MIHQGFGIFQNPDPKTRINNENKPDEAIEPSYFFYPSQISLEDNKFYPLSIQPFFESDFFRNFAFIYFSEPNSNKITFKKIEHVTDSYGIEIDIQVKVKHKSKYFNEICVALRVQSNKMNLTKRINIKLIFEINQGKKIFYQVKFGVVARPDKQNIIILNNFYNLVFPKDGLPVTDHIISSSNSNYNNNKGVLSIQEYSSNPINQNSYYDFKGDYLYTNLVDMFHKFVEKGYYIEVANVPFTQLSNSIKFI